MKKFCYCFATFICLITFTGRVSADLASVKPIIEFNTDKARENLLRVLSGEWVSRALYAAVKLEIADYLQEGPKTVYEIALYSQSNPDSLQRTLHLLSSFGIFEEHEGNIFANNEASALLSKTHPDSLHSLSLFYGEEMHCGMDQIANSVVTGTPAFQLAFKQPVFSYFKEHSERGGLFQQAMKEKAKAVIQSSLEVYNFGQFNSVYDIGGGLGHFMLALLQKYPHLRGTVFDLPEVINAIPKRHPEILEEQCTLTVGDFFESVPKGGDAYLLKSVLHDWDDSKAEEILKNCHQAMNANSKLVIVEVVLLPKDQSVYPNCMDFLMLAITGGKERSLASFSQMLDKAGFVLENVYPTSTEFSILEAKKK